MAGESSVRSTELACPRCGSAMVRRIRRRDRAPFWGCPRYPECQGTRPYQAINLTRLDRPGPPVAGAVPWNDPSWRRAEAGASARETYDRRLARHASRVRERRPRLLMSGAILALLGVVLLNLGSTMPVLGVALIFLAITSTVAG